MTQYLISFNDGAMTFPDDDLPAVADAAHAVMREAQRAGIWVFGAGLHSQESVLSVSEDGSAHQLPVLPTDQFIGGFSIINVDSVEEAITWAGKIAKACRCSQMVREIMDDPEAHSPSLRS